MSIEKILDHRYEREIRLLNLDRHILHGFLTIFSVLLLGMSYLFTLHSYYSTTHVDYSELNQSQREVAYRVIQSLKGDYLHLAKEIKFVNNRTEMGDEFTVGLNHRQGKKITILYEHHTENYLRMLVCHELLHSLVSSQDYDIEERFVDDIAWTEVCFK